MPNSENESIVLSDEEEDKIPAKRLRRRKSIEVFPNIQLRSKISAQKNENQAKEEAPIKIPSFLWRKRNLKEFDEKGLPFSNFFAREFKSLTNFNPLLDQIMWEHEMERSNRNDESYIRFILKSPARKLLFPGTSITYESQVAEHKTNTLLIYPEIDNEQKYQDYKSFLEKNELKDCCIDMTQNNPMLDSVRNFIKTKNERDIIKYKNFFDHLILSEYYKGGIGQKIMYLSEMSLKELCDISNFEDLVETRMQNKGFPKERFEEKLKFYFNELKTNPKVRFLEFRNLIVNPKYAINFNIITKNQEKFLCETMRHLKYGSNLLQLIERDYPGKDQQFYHEKCFEYYMTYKTKPKERKEGIFQNLIIKQKAYKSGNIDEFIAKTVLVKRDDTQKLNLKRSSPSLKVLDENSNHAAQSGESLKESSEIPSAVRVRNFSFNFKTNSQRSKESSSDQSSTSNSNDTVIFVPSKKKMSMQEYENEVSKSKRYRLCSPNRSLTSQSVKEVKNEQTTEIFEISESKEKSNHSIKSSTVLQKLDHIDLFSEIQKMRTQLSTPKKGKSSPCLDTQNQNVAENGQIAAKIQTPLDNLKTPPIQNFEVAGKSITRRLQLTISPPAKVSESEAEENEIAFNDQNASLELSNQNFEVAGNSIARNVQVTSPPESSNFSSKVVEAGENEIVLNDQNLSQELSNQNLEVAGNSIARNIQVTSPPESSNLSTKVVEGEENEIVFNDQNASLELSIQNLEVARNPIARSLKVISPSSNLNAKVAESKENGIVLNDQNLSQELSNQNLEVSSNPIARSLKVISPPPESSNLTTVETSVMHQLPIKSEKLDSNEILDTILENLKSESNIKDVVLVKTEFSLGANFRRQWRRKKDEFIKNFVLNDMVIPKFIFSAIKFKGNYNKILFMQDIIKYHAAVEQEKAKKGNVVDVPETVMSGLAQSPSQSDYRTEISTLREQYNSSEVEVQFVGNDPESSSIGSQTLAYTRHTKLSASQSDFLAAIEYLSKNTLNRSKVEVQFVENGPGSSSITSQILADTDAAQQPQEPAIQPQLPQHVPNANELLKESQIKKEKLSEHYQETYSEVEFLENETEKPIEISDDEDNQTSSEEMTSTRYVPANDSLLEDLERRNRILPAEKRYSFDLIASTTPDKLLGNTQTNSNSTAYDLLNKDFSVFFSSHLATDLANIENQSSPEKILQQDLYKVSKKLCNLIFEKPSDVFDDLPKLCVNCKIRRVEFKKDSNVQFQLFVDLREYDLFLVSVKNEISIKKLLFLQDSEWDALLNLLNLIENYELNIWNKNFTKTVNKVQKTPIKDISTIIDQFFKTLPRLKPFYFRLEDDCLICLGDGLNVNYSNNVARCIEPGILNQILQAKRNHSI